jgi:hypothetical protein
MTLFYLLLSVVISCLLGLVLGILVTRRSYRGRLDAAQANAGQAWADYQEMITVAARWKRLYYNLQGRA